MTDNLCMDERRTVLLVGGDLMARARLEAAAREMGVELVTSSQETLETKLRERRPAMVVLDLDIGGDGVLAALERARGQDLVPERVVGYFSHVDATLGQAARAAGCEAMPRGRFWRSLTEILRDAC